LSFLLQKIEGATISLSEVRGRKLRIGRGTNAQLRSENAALALDHAFIEEIEDHWDLVDRGSITGTYVNGRTVERVRLNKGDVLEIADLRVTVQLADPLRPLFLRIEQRPVDVESPVDPRARTVDTPALKGAVIKAPRVDFADAYKLGRGAISKRSLSWLVLLGSVGGTLLFAASRKQESFQPGAISVAHSTATRPDGKPIIGPNNCQACHDPFEGASDSKCNACHEQIFHQASRAATGSCIGCHAEHRKMPHLAAVQQSKCADCHESLGRFNPKSVRALRITRFDLDHPEFVVPVQVGGVTQRLAVTQQAVLTSDENPLKFNHQCHLTGDCNVRPATLARPQRQREQLTCDSCHQVEPSSGRVRSLSYEQACAGCHLLTFDNRFPPVPHRLDLETVAGVIANAYSGNTALLQRKPDELVRIFAGRLSSPPVNVGSATVRNAQRVLRVRCVQCHELNPDGKSVVAPLGARSWFAGMRGFSHSDHLTENLGLSCVQCHKGVIRSPSSRDLSLPSVSDCTGCHKPSRSHRGAGLDRCATCHDYHDNTSRFGPGWSRRAAKIPATAPAVAPKPLAAAGSLVPVGIMVLPDGGLSGGALLAVLAVIVLAAIALFAFLKKSRRDDLGPVPRSTVAREAGPIDARPGGSPSSSGDNAGLTVALQWHGALIGVDGVWKGRRIPVTEEGMYIGRDQQDADLVIASPMISRRHVWIGTKGDKVFAIDHDSTNGTFLNDPQSTRITEVELKHGDVIILGENAASFRFEV